MYHYEFVTVKLKKGFTGVTLAEHREIIEDYARRGFRFVNYIPTREAGHGMLYEIDLVFEKNQ